MSFVLACLLGLLPFHSLVKADFILQSFHSDASCATDPVHYFLFEYGDFCTQWKNSDDNSVFYAKIYVTSTSSSSVTTLGTMYDDAACTVNPQSEPSPTTIPLGAAGCAPVDGGWSTSFDYYVERPVLPAEKAYIVEGGYVSSSACSSASSDDLLVGVAWLLDGCIPTGTTSVKFTASGNTISHHSYPLAACAGTDTIDGTATSGSCFTGPMNYDYPHSTSSRINLDKSYFIKPVYQTIGGGSGKDGKDGKDGKESKGADKGKSKAPTPGVTSKAPTLGKDAKSKAPTPGKDKEPKGKLQ